MLQLVRQPDLLRLDRLIRVDLFQILHLTASGLRRGRRGRDDGAFEYARLIPSLTATTLAPGQLSQGLPMT